MADAPLQVEQWVAARFLHLVPVPVAALDFDSNVVWANPAFEARFGPWQGKKCYEVYGDHRLAEAHCRVPELFADGRPRTAEASGLDAEGRFTHFTRHSVPIADDRGRVAFVIEMLTDVTEAERIRREHQLLFDQVPCSVLIIDRDFRIVRSNRTLRDMLGEVEGGYCFAALKGRDSRCLECTARQTFEDGRLHTGHHSWRMKDGRTVHLHVMTVPLRLPDESFEAVMELAVDITGTMQLQDRLALAHSFMEAVIENAMDGIFAVNQKGKVILFNPAARRLFGVADEQVVSREELAAMLPKGFLARVSEAPRHVYLPDTVVRTLAGEPLPVRLVGTPLRADGQPLGMAFTVQDQRELKALEKEKLAAERLAVVGQTVAGLAHGIKNLVIALEGGMYMLATGFRKGEIERVQKGVDNLNRNIERLAGFVQTFLRFARGRGLQVRLNDPAELAREVTEALSAKAEAAGVALAADIQPGIRRAPFDYEALREALTNIVDNALDACRAAGDGKPHQVRVALREEEGSLVYEVTDDGPGIAPEVQQKLFTTIFTTKGLSGTGLGLLMANKAVRDHGGSIFLHSVPPKGTTFRILLPRLRLPRLDTGH